MCLPFPQYIGSAGAHVGGHSEEIALSACARRLGGAFAGAHRPSASCRKLRGFSLSSSRTVALEVRSQRLRTPGRERRRHRVRNLPLPSEEPQGGGSSYPTPSAIPDGSTNRVQRRAASPKRRSGFRAGCLPALGLAPARLGPPKVLCCKVVEQHKLKDNVRRYRLRGARVEDPSPVRSASRLL